MNKEKDKTEWIGLPPDMMVTAAPMLCMFLFGILFTAAQNRITFWIALFITILGTVLLFIARLPLYKKRIFFSLGPGRLPKTHRKIYFLSYCFIVLGIILLGMCVISISINPI